MATRQGTMAAVIASLLDLQWTPRAADEWIDSDGEEFALRRCDRGRLLEYALRGALEEAVWKKASKWHLGLGLAGGVDLTITKRHLRQLRSRGDAGRAAVLEMVASAALWPAARRLGADGLTGQSEVHQTAPACSQAASSTVLPVQVGSTSSTGTGAGRGSGAQEGDGDVPGPPRMRGSRPDESTTAEPRTFEELRTEDGEGSTATPPLADPFCGTSTGQPVP